MKSILIFFFALATALVSVSATTVILYPIGDTYLNEGYPSTNYGPATIGYTFTDVGNTGYKYGLVTKFNISVLAGHTINSCSVTYQQTGTIAEEVAGPEILFDVYNLVTDWLESALTWNNPPTKMSSTPILSNHQDYDVSNVIFPTTSSIQSALSAGRQLVSWLVVSDYYPYVGIFMREYSDPQYRPNLTCDVTL